MGRHNEAGAGETLLDDTKMLKKAIKQGKVGKEPQAVGTAQAK